MNEEPKYKVGQWIRFAWNGTIKLGVITYIKPAKYYPHNLCYYTETGIVTEESILEAR